MQITKMPLDGPNRYHRKLIKLLYYSYHYTANIGRNAGVDNHFQYANRKGFVAANGVRYQDSSCKTKFVIGAANVYIDSKKIGEFIPVNEFAPHVGAPQGRYTAFVKKNIPKASDGLYYPNNYIVGAEVCINPESDIYQALEFLGWHAAKTLREAGRTPEHFIRHFDVTGKWCPAMSIDEKTWAIAKKELEALYKVECTWIPYIPFEDVKDRVKYYFENPKAEPVASKDSPLRKKAAPAPTPKPAEPVVKPTTPAPKPAAPAEKLMTGVEIQKYLNKIKITDAAGKPLAEDGKIGPKTIEAIKKLELKCGMKVKDGKWDMELQLAAKKLFK